MSDEKNRRIQLFCMWNEFYDQEWSMEAFKESTPG